MFGRPWANSIGLERLGHEREVLQNHGFAVHLAYTSSS